MARALRNALLLLPPGLLAATWLVVGQGTGPGSTEQRTLGAGVAPEVEPEVELASFSGAPPAVSPGAAAAHEAEPDRRTPAFETQPATEPPAPPPPVMGLVVDGRGSPLPGVSVGLHTTSEDSSPNDDRSDSLTPFPRTLFAAQVVTDPHGAFTFEGSDRHAGGTLTFGAGYLLHGSISQPVIRDTPRQILEIPDGPSHDSVWRIHVTGPDGAPVQSLRAELHYAKGAITALPHTPLPAERFIEQGFIEQRGLPPGRWRMSISSDRTLLHDVEVQVTKPRSIVESSVVMEVFPGAFAERIAHWPADESGKPWVDPSSGLLDKLPEERLAIGQDRRDRHFAQSLTFSGDGLRAAQLVLDLRANSGMSSNDGIYLLHRSDGSYAWGNRVAAVTGGRWSNGMRRRVVLDLARLPLKGGGTLDLRPQLAGGRLDVVIQDDTAVLDLDLRIVR